MFEKSKIYPLWNFFTKVKVSVIIILILTFITGINTFLPISASDEMVGYEIYHSWWYISILILFFLNILICTINRFPATLTLFRSRNYNITRKSIELSEIVMEIDVSADKMNNILDNLNIRN